MKLKIFYKVTADLETGTKELEERVNKFLEEPSPIEIKNINYNVSTYISHDKFSASVIFTIFVFMYYKD